MKNKYSKLRLDKTESILVKMFEDLILDTLHERISREENENNSHNTPTS